MDTEDGDEIVDPARYSNSDADRSPENTKRKRINACQPCHARKIKCDGARPTCKQCARRRGDAQDCIYKQWKAKLIKKDATPKQLHDRIRYLERLLAQSSNAQLPTLGGMKSKEIKPLTPPVLISPLKEEGLSSHPSPDYVVIPSAPAGFQSSSSDSSQHQPQSTLSSGTARGITTAATSGQDQANDSLGCPSTKSSTVTGEYPSPIDAMGSGSYLADSDDRQREEFYGDSSAAYFMEQVAAQAGGRTDRVPGLDGVPDRTRYSINKRRSTSRQMLRDHDPSAPLSPDFFSLPPRALAEELFQIYWQRGHPLYPFLHRPSVEKAFESVWENPESRRAESSCGDVGLGSSNDSGAQSPVFHCAMNSMFALSCQLAGPEFKHKDRDALSQTFFIRSRRLLHVDILDLRNLALVQTLLLVSQQLQGTAFPSRCWVALTLACRLGQGLGLHVDDPRITFSATELEIRRRTWHGCTIMDTVTSMTLGRPMITPPQFYVTLPTLALDGAFICADEEDGNRASPSLLHFFIDSIKLYHILGKVLSEVYRPWSNHSSTGSSSQKDVPTAMSRSDVEKLIALDVEISDFEDSLAPALDWRTDASTIANQPASICAILLRQRSVLGARCLHTRLLLYRPTFLQYCQKLTHKSRSRSLNNPPSAKPQVPRQLRATVAIQSSISCITVAIDLIQLLHTATRNSAEEAWWYTIFYLSTAGMVLILAESCIPMHNHFDINDIKIAWEVCCEALCLLGEHCDNAKQALGSLNAVRQRLVSSQIEYEPQGSDIHESQRRISAAVSREEGDVHLRVPSPKQATEQVDFSPQPDAVNEAGYSPMQPLMDFMDQDMDYMPLTLLEETWWNA